MTALQAIQQAQETGKIAITERTANILKALAAFEQATEDMTAAIDDNLPSEMNDSKTHEMIIGGFYDLYSPLQEYLFKTIGKIMFDGVFLFSFRDQFEGL